MTKLGDLTATAEGLNRWERDSVGRAWQIQLIEFGTLTLPNGAFEYGSVPIDEDRYELRPYDPALPRFVTSDIGLGWAIIGVVQGDEVHSLASTDLQPVILELETSFVRAVRPKYEGLDLSQLPRNIRLGHENFAHFLWNNLPALILWEERLALLAAKGRLSFDITSHSLGQLRCLGSESELLPLLASYVTVGEPWPPPNTVRVGAQLVTREALRRVRASLASVAHESISRPRLWLGVRHPNLGRSPDNIGEFLSEVASFWLRETSGDVVVDGYTVDENTGGTHRDLDRQADSLPLVGEIIERAVSGDRSTSSRIKSTASLSLRESLALAGSADYYICGPGTTQHKIGWIWNKPGVIVAPPTVHRDAEVRWPGLMVQDGLLPDQLPIEFVEWTEPPSRFQIVDPRGAARWSVYHALEKLKHSHD